MKAGWDCQRTGDPAEDQEYMNDTGSRGDRLADTFVVRLIQSFIMARVIGSWKGWSEDWKPSYGDHKSVRSISDVSVVVGSIPVSWMSKCQGAVATST